MDPISIILGLANFAPTLMKWANAGDKVQGVADKVGELARVVTGQPTTPEAIEALHKDKELAIKFQTDVMANETQLQQIYLADVQSARNRDVDLAKAGVKNTRAQLLAGFASALVIVCLAITVWVSTLDEYAKGIITLILGRALGWVEQIFSFEFGTTRQSKAKDETISNLSKPPE